LHKSGGATDSSAGSLDYAAILSAAGRPGSELSCANRCVHNSWSDIDFDRRLSTMEMDSQSLV